MWLVGGEEEAGDSGELLALQAHPEQKFDHDALLFAPQPDLVAPMVQYALNHWVYTAVNKIAGLAAGANFMVVSRPDGLVNFDDHPILALLGRFGMPAPDVDSFEFFEGHFQFLLTAGNSYWLWENSRGRGVPDRVRLLNPAYVRVVPGRDETVGVYRWNKNGLIVDYAPEQITHFKRANPYSRYYGLSALAVLLRLIFGDNAMLDWNNEFFGENLGLPSGVLVVPADTSDAEIERIRQEFVARHGGQRTVAIIKAEGGSAVWLEAGLKHRDYDFTEGRTLSRKAVYEALDLSLGVMAETSTEAHAIVSERRLMESVHLWHERTCRRVNGDALAFWPNHRRVMAMFEDVRKQAVDWRRESLRREADERIMTIDEMRQREYQLPPIQGATVAQGGGRSDADAGRDAGGA